MNYSEKLRDPRWQRKRLEIMQRDNFACTVCNDTTETLNVHHEKYVGEPWDCPSDKLKTICETCHKKEHGIIQDTNRISIPLQVKEIYDISKKWGEFRHNIDQKKIDRLSQDVSLREEREIYQEILKQDLPDERMIEVLTEIKKIDTKRSNLRKEFYG